MNNISELKSKKKKYTNNIFGHGLGLQVEENEITFFWLTKRINVCETQKREPKKKSSEGTNREF